MPPSTGKHGMPTPSASQSGTGHMSPLNSSSAARHQTTNAPPANRASLATSPDELVRQLLQTIKGTLDTVSQTIDMVGETTEHVAGLSPAMEMAKQAGEIGRELEKQENKQDEQMKKLKEHMKTVARENVEGYLAQAVEEIVKEEVSKQIAKKVADQLQAQIPLVLRRQSEEHSAAIANARVRLHNAEARRLNSIPKISTSEPLHPLLRSNGRPSDYFPYNLSALLGMSAGDAKRLLRDFDLSTSEQALGVHSGQVPRITIGDEEEQRVLCLNAFLHHIGVGFEVLPARPSPGGQSSVPPSPIFVQSH